MLLIIFNSKFSIIFLQEEVDEGEPAQYVAREFNDLTESYQQFMKKVCESLFFETFFGIPFPKYTMFGLTSIIYSILRNQNFCTVDINVHSFF